ncbi:uncharacterized protein LOC123320949 [Coccinella septempunctata]|uniref:uncharacterized protein LOC123320949 n=1 Tax=Coccinella septempunctata TaxID=41139 RepID=UPI001D082232|nr:uncharacterized protein LOC123320949 [Coccinella septempunctata]
MPEADPKFLQIYFMGDEEQRTNTRCAYNHIDQMQEREIVEILETLLLNNNHLLRLFKTLSNRLQNDNYAIVIKADKVPYGEHAGTYNVPTINEVAVVMAGDPSERRDIRIQRRDNTVQIIQDNHRSYDALQYPLIFWEGEDGYHFNIKQRNPTTGVELTTMTINKSQGQTMTICGLDLENPCFSHGQLYVACSRVGKPSNLFVYIPQGVTKNIVHPMALS